MVAALVAKEAAKLEATALAWVLPEGIDAAVAAEAIVTGTVLGPYRYDRFLSTDPDEAGAAGIESLTLVGPEEAADAARAAGVVADAVNRARDLQSTPANFATPTYLGERAEEIAAAHDSVSAEVLGPAELAAKKMGGIIAVSQGGPQEPRLIVLRYSGGGSGPTLGPGRQGRDLRHRRHLAEARRRHAGDEVRHVRRGGGAGDGRGDRRARPAGRRDRRRPLDREHALRAARSSPAT